MRTYSCYDTDQVELDKIELVRKQLSGFDEFDNLGAARKDSLCKVVADKLTLDGCDKRGVVIEEVKFVIFGKGSRPQQWR